MEIPIHTPIQQYISKMKLWRFTQKYCIFAVVLKNKKVWNRTI